MQPERPGPPEGGRPTVPSRTALPRRRPAAGRAGGRRRHPRAPFRALVELHAGELRRRVRAVDVSPGGLGVALGPVGELPAVARAELPLPGLRLPLALDAELAWVDSRGGRAGFRFCGGDEALRELLARFVEDLLARRA